MPRLFALVVLLVLSACTSIPINQQTIRGRYEMLGKPEGGWYAGEALVLGDGTFQYWLFTPVPDDPRSGRYPVSGRYTLEGSTITLHHPAVLVPQRSITREGKQFLLWTDKQLAAYRDTHRQPDDLLLQRK